MIYFVLKYIRFNCIKHMYRAQLFRIPPIIIAMQTFPAVYCVLYTVPDRSGKELGSVEVGDGKSGGDEELAEHGEGEDEPDE